MSRLQMVAVGVLVLVYGGSGLPELVLWRRFEDRFVKWGYPRYFAIVTPLLKIVASIALLLPPTRDMGALLCALIGTAAVASVFRARDRRAYIPACIVLIVTLGALWIIFHPATERLTPLN